MRTGWQGYPLHRHARFALFMLTVTVVGAWTSLAFSQPAVAMGFVAGVGGCTIGVMYALTRRLGPTE